MAQLEFGIMDGFEAEGPASSPAETFDQHIALAKTAERLGYRYYFFIEHQNAFFTCVTSPNVYLAALARETSTLRFGPMVYQVPMYHPMRLAQDAAMVDQLSHGRLEFGLGYGPRIDEFRRWKLPFTERREMGIEAMDIILKAWTQDSVSYEGEYWTFDEALPKPKPYQQPHPPVWLGGHSETSFDYAAKMNFHVAQNIDVDSQVAEKFAYWRQKWEEQGHPGPRPRQLLVRHVHVAETDEQARAEAEPSMVRGMRGGVKRVLAPEERTAVMEEIVRVYEETSSYDFWIENGLALVGSPETVVRRLQEQQAAVGYDVFCAQHQLTGMEPAVAQKSIRLFGEGVIPAFT
jgi:alkanesulfonate monooxygenase SsuD/methylene tetrahydromethanopterin reductase-like flavin-dependent oxidoreductase (luciferase family)